MENEVMYKLFIINSKIRNINSTNISFYEILILEIMIYIFITLIIEFFTKMNEYYDQNYRNVNKSFAK